MARILALASLCVCCLVLSLSPTRAAGDIKLKPATVAEIRDAIDWSKVPVPPGGEVGRRGLSSCTIKAPGTFLEAAEFFRRTMPALGWKEDATPIAGVDQKNYLYLTFDKGDMHLSVNGYRSDAKAPMTIVLTNDGNVDIRSLPKPPDAKFLSNLRVAALFTTGGKPEEAVDFCRKALLERGWQEVPDDSAKFFAKEGRIVLRFLQNAMEIGVVASKNAAGQAEVTISGHVRYRFDPGQIRNVLTPREIPVPATEKEYLAVLDLRGFPLMKGARKRDRQTEEISRSNAITCQAPGNLNDAVGFHRKALAERGWKETQFDNAIEDRAELRFEKQGYLVTVNLGQQKKEDVQISVINHGNVDLRQLPYPPGVEISPERDTVVNCSTTISEPDTVAFYRKKLAASGWHEAKARGRGSYLFLQNACILQMEIQENKEGGTAIKIMPYLFTADKSAAGVR